MLTDIKSVYQKLPARNDYIPQVLVSITSLLKPTITPTSRTPQFLTFI